MALIRLDRAAVSVPVAGGERVLLAPTDLRLTEHRIGMIGANGSGKSTLARLLNGLVRPTAGRVMIDDLDTVRDGAAVRRRVGFCFTDPAAQLVMPTCVEDVELSLRRSIKDREERHARAMAILDEYGLHDQADQSVHALSGGQRQLLALAGVLASDPDVVVADEPTTLLDLANTRSAARRLFGLSQQLVLVTHDLELALGCDRVIVLDSAEVVFDGTAVDAVQHYRHTVTA